MENKKNTTSKRLTLWVIWATALMPLGAAVLAYALKLPVTQGQTNHGELVSPVRTLSQWGGAAELYTGHWTLVVKPGSGCLEPCQSQVERLKSVHDALGRDASRVRVRVPQVEQLSLDQGIWLVDPNGNLILRYAPDQLGEPLLQDLKRLLKVSRLG